MKIYEDKILNSEKVGLLQSLDLHEFITMMFFSENGVNPYQPCKMERLLIQLEAEKEYKLINELIKGLAVLKEVLAEELEEYENNK